jgi:hypothetical protein
MAVTDALGQFIFVANPYKAQPNTAPFPTSPPAPILNNPPLPNLDLLFGLCLNEVESQEYGIGWDFKGVKRYVQKTIRIPYMYYRADANGGSTLVTDYLLIGYEGGAGGF